MQSAAISGVGHNGAPNSVKSFLTRLSRLTDDRDAVNADIREVLAEAKATGLDPKVLRRALARSRRDKQKVQEEDALLELYEADFFA